MTASQAQDSVESRGPGFAVLYRVRLHPGMEHAYVSAWGRVTAALRTQRGGLGSRLHRGPDDIWYAYAQWPSAEARRAAFALGPVDEAAEKQMASAVAERLPEIVLEPMSDYLLPGPYEAPSERTI